MLIWQRQKGSYAGCCKASWVSIALSVTFTSTVKDVCSKLGIMEAKFKINIQHGRGASYQEWMLTYRKVSCQENWTVKQGTLWHPRGKGGQPFSWVQGLCGVKDTGPYSALELECFPPKGRLPSFPDSYISYLQKENNIHKISWTQYSFPMKNYFTSNMLINRLQAPLSMGFSRQEYWSGLPCPPPGGLID